MTDISAPAPAPAASAELRARLATLPRPALWAIAARFKTLSLSQVPVLAASALAAQAGLWRLDVMLAAMIGAGAIQLGTNLWNDASDGERGVDAPDRLGPPRMTALGLLDAPAVRRGAAGAFGLATLAGLWLLVVGGWPVVAIGLVSLALGYLYSMGPQPLSGLPFGEILVILFFGVVATSGTGWLMGLDPLAPRLLLVGLMIGLPAASVLMLNNHRDRVQDIRAGRRTLAILLGQTGARMIYALGLFGALALGAALTPSLWLIFPGGLALWLSVAIWRWPVSARLNRLLGQTALFQALLVLVVLIG